MSSTDVESGYSEKTPILHPGRTLRESRGSLFSRFLHFLLTPWNWLSEAVPARYALAFWGCLGFSNVYAMRVNLSVALVAMVKAPVEHSTYETMACQELVEPFVNTTTHVNSIHGEFDWDPALQSQILGAFFIGYVITQIPGGILAEKYGAKWLYGIGVLITALFTLLTPIAARFSPEALMAVRFIEGLGEGVTFPAMNALIGRWVPKLERSRLATIIFSGSPIGTVAALALSGYISSSHTLGGWPMVFYLFGALGVFWFIFWICLIHESPEVHPRISKTEREFIRSGQDQTQRTGRIPWCSLLKSGPLWALAVTHFGYNWGFYTLLTELPTYLSNILHFNLKQNGLLSAAPYVFQTIFAFSASAIADKLRATSVLRITTIRKIMNSNAFYLPGLFVGLVAVTGCQSHIIVGLIITSVAFSGFMYSGFNVTHVDMSPEFAGTLMGITNCIANMAGFLAPTYVGWAIKDGSTVQNWSFVFLTTAGVYFVTGTIYNIFASAELQPWGVSAPTFPPTPSTSFPPSVEEAHDTPATQPPNEDSPNR